MVGQPNKPDPTSGDSTVAGKPNNIKSFILKTVLISCKTRSKNRIKGMSCASVLHYNSQPRSMSRARQWTDEVENLYRFQQAGYRDELEYKQIKQAEIDRWPETGFVKKLQRRDNTFYYYNRKRECEDRDVHKVKVYVY